MAMNDLLDSKVHQESMNGTMNGRNKRGVFDFVSEIRVNPLRFFDQ